MSCAEQQNMGSMVKMKQEITTVQWLYKLMVLLVEILRLAYHCIEHRLQFWWDQEKKKKLVSYMNKVAHMQESALKIEDWQDTLFTWPMFKQECRMLYLDLYKNVHLHAPARNVNLSYLDGTPCKLFDFTNGSRPLVVNIGSCS